jgi:hypothetical protein
VRRFLEFLTPSLNQAPTQLCRVCGGLRIVLQDEEFEGGPKAANKDDVWAVKKAYTQAHTIAVECWISEISDGAGSSSLQIRVKWLGQNTSKIYTRIGF